jgi:hypothetical protein
MTKSPKNTKVKAAKNKLRGLFSKFRRSFTPILLIGIDLINSLIALLFFATVSIISPPLC